MSGGGEIKREGGYIREEVSGGEGEIKDTQCLHDKYSKERMIYGSETQRKVHGPNRVPGGPPNIF